MARFRQGRLRQKRLRYALSSGILAFAGGWAVVAILMPTSVFSNFPRWQSSLWTHLGAHFVKISDVHFGGAGFRLVDPIAATALPDYIYFVPIIAVAASAAFTCYHLRSTRIKHNVSNALAAGMSYFLAGMVAMVLTNARPAISTLLIIALVVGGGVWIGSTVMGFLTRGFPFIGIASLGGIAAVGVLIILGGVAILSVIQGLVVISFGGAVVIGTSFGISRRLERRGRNKDSEFSRTRGLKSLVAEYWKVILASAIVGIALFVGLTKGP